MAVVVMMNMSIGWGGTRRLATCVCVYRWSYRGCPPQRWRTRHFIIRCFSV